MTIDWRFKVAAKLVLSRLPVDCTALAADGRVALIGVLAASLAEAG
jgi:hypothetical protein